MMEKERTIFISYRREDSAHAAGRLFDRLSEHFGSERIFIDVDTIELGEDFVNEIEEAVSSCDVLVAIIGNQWLSVTNADGAKRLDDPNDFVRLEIISAFDQGIDVVPLLLDGATMPQADDLPEVLVPLTRRNGLAVGYLRFNTDVDRLIRGIEVIFEARAAREAAEAELAKANKLVESSDEADRTGQVDVIAPKDISKETRRLVLLIVTLGWLLSGITFAITHMFDVIPRMDPPLIPAVLGGVISAVVIVVALKRLISQIQTETLVIFVIGWVIGVSIGWAASFPYGDIQVENYIPLGGVIGGFIVGLTTSYLLSKVFRDLYWTHFLTISVGWSVAWAVGLLVNHLLYVEYSSSFLFTFFTFLLTTVLVGGLLFWQTGKFDAE